MILTGGSQLVELSPALPINNKIFAQHGVKLRKSQFSILAAAPSVGKSTVARNLAVHADAESLYLSVDSDEWTTTQSVLGILTGEKLETLDNQLNLGNPKVEKYYQDILLRDASHIDWAFRADMEREYIYKRIAAHETVWDKLPDFVFVDNIMDLVQDENNESQELRGICRELKKIARATEAHVMALHHVNGDKEDGDRPINLKDLQYKLGKIPEVVLGLHYDGRLWMTVPKNRGGKRGLQINLPVDYETGFIGGFNA